MNIAFAWAGSPIHHRDYRRSTDIGLWLPLWGVLGTQWWSVQVGPRQADLDACVAPNVIDYAAGIKDYEDTAAVIERADLVITVDTSVAHLAGRLDTPCWILLASAPDWRWLQTGETTHWYPRTRLYRQATPGDWGEVMARVEADLRRMMTEKAA